MKTSHDPVSRWTVGSLASAVDCGLAGQIPAIPWQQLGHAAIPMHNEHWHALIHPNIQGVTLGAGGHACFYPHHTGEVDRLLVPGGPHP